MKRRSLFRGRLLPCALLLFLVLSAAVAVAVALPAALAPIAFGERLFCMAAALFVLRHAPPESKNARLFLILLLPCLGALLCLFLPKETAAAPQRTDPLFGDPVSNGMIALAARKGLKGGFARSVKYFSTGAEMFPSLLGDLASARREILLDYYILARGKFFDSVLAVLEQKAAEGVDVELVYDGFGCAALPANFFKTLKKRGIDARVYHPIKPFPLSRLNRRDHRKLAVIDGDIAYTGGVNLADEYIGEEIRFGHWKDSAVRVTGEPAAAFCALFGKERVSSAGSVPCVPFADEGGDRVGEEIFLRLIGSAHRTLFLCTPYFIPGDRVLLALGAAAKAGADVRLMIPHIPDKKSVFLLTRGFARKAAAYGVQVREYTAGFLHAKSLTADGLYCAVGSYNLDRRSLAIQSECGVFLKDERLASEIDRDFSAMWEAGTPLKKQSAGERISFFFLAPFAPLI